jgi:putative membrane-bound dehydrogenase-like protein
MIRFALGLVAFVLFLPESTAQKTPPRKIKVLFLGDNGHHRPAERFRQIEPVLAERGIELTYTDRAEALNPKILHPYDGLLVYANFVTITPEQEKALLDFVERGKGFIPVHCASYCFLNSSKYIELVGAQFKSHGAGTFKTILAESSHPVLSGYKPFESWDETYIHHKHNDKDRIILEYRQEKQRREPWTWVRTQGKGRVFYTAWGHDERTWGHPGFQNLIERGIRWAVGGDPQAADAYATGPKMTDISKDAPAFEYVDIGGKIPDYKQGAGKTQSLMQKPLSPADALKHVVHPVHFELQLFAAEDLLGGKPICMSWDERGRLWVAVTVDYPNELQPPGKGRDRILILEDAKGSGRADRVKVFADKLSIPTSLIFARGGVIVHQAPDTLFLQDTDGDDIADKREVLFSGWHTGDTHAGPSNLQLGLDNWIYGIVGYAGFTGTVGGERHRFGQGFYRFKSDGSRLEFLRSTSNNSWGVGFSEEGDLFGSTANGNPSVHLAIPNRYYERVRGWSSSVLPTIAEDTKFYPVTEKVRQVDYHGRFTAAAGHALYTARAYPKEYWNRTAFVAEPTGHLVATFTIQPNGSSYRSRNAWNLLAGQDEWCAPIAAEVGPDGNVWVIDWYSYIIQHNPTPPGFRTGKGNAYETDLRDTQRGRIYRLIARKPQTSTPLSLADAPPEKLVETLRSDNLFWRRHAQRLLLERGKKDVVPALCALVGDRTVDAIGLNVGAIHALWTLHGLGAIDGADPGGINAVLGSLQHPSAGVRRNAALVTPLGRADAMLEAGLLKDPNPHVRLAALLRLSDMPTTSVSASALVDAFKDEALIRDRWLYEALTSAAAAHSVKFLSALLHQWTQSLSEERKTLVERVAEHVGRAGLAEDVPPLLDALAASEGFVADAVVTGLARGWPKQNRVPLTATREGQLGGIIAKLSPAGRGRLVSLAAAWGTKSLEKYAADIVDGFVAAASNEKETEAHRLQAATQLIEFRNDDDKAAEHLLKLLTPSASPQWTQGLLDALSRSDAPSVGPALIGKLPTFTPATKPDAIRVLLRRADWTELLLGVVDTGGLSLSELSLEQKQGLTSHPNKQIAARAKVLLAKGGGLPSADRQKIIEEYMPWTAKKGDADAGKALFKTHCAKCHTHGGEGTKIGPDLSGMAVHSKAHLLTEILDPNRSVEGNYRQYTVTTHAGRILNGLLASESKTAIEIIDPEAKKHTLQREEIDVLQASSKSLMPEGFEKQLKAEEMANLLEFLTRRGKYLPLSLERIATAVSTRGMFNSEDSKLERLVFPDWSPRTFKGVPFHLVDPQDGRAPNVLLFYSPQGKIPPKMPKSVLLPCNAPASAVHLLSGVSGWGYPFGSAKSISLTVRFHYQDGKTEDHPLRNGEHFADYIRRVDVPGSEFAFDLGGRQIRYLAIRPLRSETIAQIEFIRGTDATAPVIMSVTVEARP